MNTRYSNITRLLLVSIGALIIAAGAQIARAQRCPDSYLRYIVHDERGQPIGADGSGLTVGPKEEGWRVGAANFLGGFAKDMASRVPPPIAQLNGHVRTLEKSKNCGFINPIKLELELYGKKMKLVFRPRPLSDNSIDYLIDSLPFQEGIFEILMAQKDRDQSAFFYPASSWEKVTEADEAFYDGQHDLDLKDYQKAIEDFTKVLKLDPKNSDAAFFIGHANINLKRYEPAIAALKQGTQINPASAVSFSLLGTAYRMNQQHKEAIEAYSTALSLASKDENWAENWEKNTRDYLRISQRALAPNQKDAQAYFDEGMDYFGAKKYAESIQSFTQAIKLKPDYAEAFTPLGVAYIQLEMYGDAVEPLREAIRRNPSRGLSHGALAQAYLNLGKSKQAFAEFKEAARLEPNRAMWADGLQDATGALDGPTDEVVKREAERLWRLNNPEYMKDATNVTFAYQSIFVKRQSKDVVGVTGTGSAGNSIDPRYSAQIKFTASVTYSKPREYVVDYKESQNLCFYKNAGETNWSAELCERLK